MVFGLFEDKPHPVASSTAPAEAAQKGGAKAARTKKVKVLGRERRVTKEGTKAFISYKGKKMALSEARDLEAKLKKAAKAAAKAKKAASKTKKSPKKTAKKTASKTRKSPKKSA